MPRTTKKPLTKAADVAQILETADFLYHVIACGLMSWLIDSNCVALVKRGIQSSKIYTLGAARAVCRRFNEEITCLLKQMAQDLVDTIIELRRTKLAYIDRDPLRHHPLVGQELLDMLAKLEKKKDKKGVECYRRQVEFQQLTEGWMPPAVALAIRADLYRSRQGNCCHLLPTVNTLFCLGQEMCQLHGGKKQCPNRCSRGPWADCVACFSLYRTPEGVDVGLFTRERCVDLCCIFPSAGIFQTAASSSKFLSDRQNNHHQDITGHLVRAMLRTRAVYHPFSTTAVEAVTNGWGTQSDQVDDTTSMVGGTTRGVQTPRVCTAPARLLVEAHPHLITAPHSLEELLHLSPEEMRACRCEAQRKVTQEVQRAEKMRMLRVGELLEDVDVYLVEHKFPVKSVAALEKVSSGMAQTIKIALSRDVSVRHALDVTCVRNALATIDVALKKLPPYIQQTWELALPSSEAFDFATGMHVGLYGTLTPPWSNDYSACDVLNLSPSSPYEKQEERHLLLSMQETMFFFDGVSSKSLEAELVANNRVLKWRVKSAMRSYSIHQVQWGSFETFSRSDLHLRLFFDRMLTSSDEEEDDDEDLPAVVDLPEPLSKKDFDDYFSNKRAKKDEEFKYLTYVKGMFEVLAARPATRCAALDLMGLTSSRLFNLLVIHTKHWKA